MMYWLYHVCGCGYITKHDCYEKSGQYTGMCCETDGLCDSIQVYVRQVDCVTVYRCMV